jgi:hypothetical protein
MGVWFIWLAEQDIIFPVNISGKDARVVIPARNKPGPNRLNYHKILLT